MIDFKGVHCPKSVVLHAVFFYMRSAASYRDVEKILAERGVTVDHATLNRQDRVSKISAMQKLVDETFEGGASDKSLDDIWAAAKAQATRGN